MFSIAYVSDEAVAFHSASLRELCTLCTERNRANAVTGYLSWQNGDFLQLLEGEESVVRDLLKSIAADRRHAIRRVVELSLWDERLFSEWGMSFHDPIPASRAAVQLESERLVHLLDAPDPLGTEETVRIGAIVERIAVLVREGDAIERLGVREG